MNGVPDWECGYLSGEMDESERPFRSLGKKTPWDEETFQRVKEQYLQGRNGTELGAEYGMTGDSIRKRLIAGGVKIRDRKEVGLTRRINRYPLREDAFGTITEESAYWVGFLMADGCVSYNTGNGGQWNLSLGLSETDREHVEKFRDFLGSGRAISTYRYKNASSSVGCRFAVCSDRLVQDLGRYGVVPRKSLTARVIGLECDRDFWRGVIDGDGSVGYTKDGYPFIGLVGSEPLLSQFAEYVRQVNPKVTQGHRRARKIWTLVVMGEKATPIIEALYANCRVALRRKHEAATHIMSNPRERMRVDWSWVTPEILLAKRAELDSWGQVANALGMHKAYVSVLKKRFGIRPTRVRP